MQSAKGQALAQCKKKFSGNYKYLQCSFQVSVYSPSYEVFKQGEEQFILLLRELLLRDSLDFEGLSLVISDTKPDKGTEDPESPSKHTG